MNERSAVRPPRSAGGSAIYEGTIASTVADNSTVTVTETTTGKQYTARNRCGATITVSGSKRVWFFWNIMAKEWQIFGYVC